MMIDLTHTINSARPPLLYCKRWLLCIACLMTGLLPAQDQLTANWFYQLPLTKKYSEIKKATLADSRFRLSKADSVFLQTYKNRDSLFQNRNYANGPLIVQVKDLANDLDRTKIDSAFVRMGFGSIQQSYLIRKRYSGAFKRLQVGYFSRDKNYMDALYEKALKELARNGKISTYYENGATARPNTSAEGKVVEVRNNKNQYWVYKIILRSYQKGYYELTIDVTLEQ